MSKIQSEYYIIARANSANYPLLIEDDGCPYYIKQKEYIPNPERMFFCIGAPKPRKPKLVDYHPVPYTVVSDKIESILAPLSIDGIQLIPSTITGKDNELHENYFYLHIYNIYELLDKDESVFSTWNEIRNQAIGLSKIVLNEEELNKIPLENRLIFKIREKASMEFYHKSVVDQVMLSNPEGIRFVSVDEWNAGSAFE